MEAKAKEDAVQLTTKEAFFVLPLKEVDAPIKDFGSVRLRELSGTLRDEFENFVVQNRTGKGKNAKPDVRGAKSLLVTLSVINPEKGTLMFERKDMVKLNRMPGAVLNDLFDAIQTLNKMGDEEIEETEGN